MPCRLIWKDAEKQQPREGEPGRDDRAGIMGLDACWQQEEQAVWEMLGKDIFSV